MGFGQDAITGLLGNVGTLDIQDTQVRQVLLLATVLYIMLQYAAETIVKNGEADGDRMVVTGGSHGGFITAHLIGQYPVSHYDIISNYYMLLQDSYKAAFIRNPVIDIACE